MSDRSWVLFGALILGLKALLLVLDPVPKFFFGDSSCYMHTAVDGWIPPDRSFAYGFVIRAVALPAGSLLPLVVLQVVASGACAILLAWMLVQSFQVPPWASCGLGLLCAVEPIQLLYERYVMAETLSLFLFVLQLAASLRYMETRSLVTLALIQLAGVGIISLRSSYLPWVLAASVLPPILGHLNPGGFPASTAPASPGPRRWRALALAGHLAVSLTVTWVLHAGYKQLFGALSGHPPGYHAAGGYFLLAAWAPVVAPEDFPDPRTRDRVFRRLAYDLQDRRTREDHLFSRGGLSNAVQASLPWSAGDRFAWTVALNAVRRDPLGVLRLSCMTCLDYFDRELLAARISNDLAMDQPGQYEEFYGVFREFFRLPGEGVQPMTTTKRWYGSMVPWYWAILLSPLLAAAGALRRWGDRRSSALLLLGAVGLSLAAVCGLGVTQVVRYLHPLAWLTVCCTGLLWRAAPPAPPLVTPSRPSRGSL